MKSLVINTRIKKNKICVWNALTNHSEMIQWFFNNIPNFKAEVGFRTWFVVDTGVRTFYHLWEVKEVIKTTSITVAWCYPDYLKESFKVKFELKDKNENTTDFAVLVEGIEKFEHLKIPELTKGSCKDGWLYFLNKLKEYLA